MMNEPIFPIVAIEFGRRDEIDEIKPLKYAEAAPARNAKVTKQSHFAPMNAHLFKSEVQVQRLSTSCR
jgi:hypothetical protein